MFTEFLHLSRVSAVDPPLKCPPRVLLPMASSASLHGGCFSLILSFANCSTTPSLGHSLSILLYFLTLSIVLDDKACKACNKVLKSLLLLKELSKGPRVIDVSLLAQTTLMTVGLLKCFHFCCLIYFSMSPHQILIRILDKYYSLQ